MDAAWTLEQDEELRAACERAGGDLSLKKIKWWEDLARGIPGTNAKGLQQRWMQIRNLPGLEYKTFAGSNPRAPSIQQQAIDPKSALATKAGYGGQRTAGVRSDRTSAPAGSPGVGAQGQAGGASSRRPFSASAVPRISATRQSAVGQLRGAAVASSHTPLLAFSKASSIDKNKAPAGGGGAGLGSPKAGREKAASNGDASASGGAGKNAEAAAGQASGSGAGVGGDKDGGSGWDGAGKSKGRGGDENLIVIHVCDENRGINRDFTCRKDVLLSEMAYFRSYLNGSESCDDIDISVHCDIQIFQWLIRYLNEPDSPPPLDTTNVISILISSQFLKMSSLVDICLTFVCGNLNEILKMPIDLNCLNHDLLSRLSARLTVEVLDDLSDRKDKLVSRLYMRKLEELFVDEGKIITRCANCGKLFARCHARELVCPKAKIFIDFHGNVMAEHVPMAKWDMNKLLLNLRARKLSWRDIYWKVWGIISLLKCSVCGLAFPAADLAHCAFCPSAPTFRPGENHGAYPCCGAPAVRFDSSGVRQMGRGCCATDHKVIVHPDTGVGGKGGGDDPHADSAAILAMLSKRMALVCTPFKDRKDGIADLLDEAGSEEDEANEDEAASDYTDSEDDSGHDPSRTTLERARQVHRGGIKTGPTINARKRKAKRSDATVGGARVEPKDQRNFRQEIWREEDHRRLATFALLADCDPNSSGGGSYPRVGAIQSASGARGPALVSQAAGRSRPSTLSASSHSSASSIPSSGGGRQQRPTSTRPTTAGGLRRGVLHPSSSSSRATSSSTPKS